MYLIDTNVISEAGKGRRCDPKVSERYRREGGEELVQSFSERLLPVDEKVAQNWGRMNARSSLPVIDSLLAATAEAHGLILVTRNLQDIEHCGVRFLTPFPGATP